MTEMAQSIASRTRGSRCPAALGCGIEVVRKGRVEPFAAAAARRSSGDTWAGVVLEEHATPACVIPQHEHREHFLHVLMQGHGDYEVKTGGTTRRFHGRPGTMFVLPRGTVDELRWDAPTRRVAIAIQPGLFARALESAADRADIELTEHWNLDDPHLVAVVRAMALDVEAGSPAGRLYGQSLASALAVYLMNRYAVRREVPAPVRGGLAPARLRRVLDYIESRLADDLPLADLAAVAGLSEHYFVERFRRSTGVPPHRYVLLQRIERARRLLGDRKRARSVIDAAAESGFTNASHFARVFRRFTGVSPSRFQADSRA
ncbi:MAG: AraC family transcriptional regulator [Rhodanobacteraceae bacterium]